MFDQNETIAITAVAEPAGRILLAEDNEHSRAALVRILRASGYEVDVSETGIQAVERLAHTRFDAIVSDIDMPDLDGLGLLARVREVDLDIPVILVTGVPEMASAIRAVELGAFRYLPKPIDRRDFDDCVRRAVKLHALARLKRTVLEAQGGSLAEPADRVALESAFADAMDSLWMAYQPIVDVGAREVYAYEALVRTTGGPFPDPVALFDAAGRLGRVQELGRRIRRRVAEDVRGLPAPTQVFVNVHPADLTDDDLFDPAAPLATQAFRVVLEITERASLADIEGLPQRLDRLRALGYRLAVDDLGAGYAGLNSVVRLEPDVIKLDMSLIRGIDRSPKRQSIVASMLRVCRELEMSSVIEGVETPAEMRTLIDLGADLVQGFGLAPPQPPFCGVDVDVFERLGKDCARR